MLEKLLCVCNSCLLLTYGALVSDSLSWIFALCDSWLLLTAYGAFVSDILIMAVLHAFTWIFAVCVTVGYTAVTLKELNTVYVPFRYTADQEPEHAVFAEASEQIAVDRANQLVYTIGKNSYYKTSLYIQNMTLKRSLDKQHL